MSGSRQGRLIWMFWSSRDNNKVDGAITQDFATLKINFFFCCHTPAQKLVRLYYQFSSRYTYILGMAQNSQIFPLIYISRLNVTISFSSFLFFVFFPLFVLKCCYYGHFCNCFLKQMWTCLSSPTLSLNYGTQPWRHKDICNSESVRFCYFW